jgi:hypothetical protein
MIFHFLFLKEGRDRQQGKARKPNTHTRIWKLTESQQTNKQTNKLETAQYNHMQQRQQKQRSRFLQE